MMKTKHIGPIAGIILAATLSGCSIHVNDANGRSDSGNWQVEQEENLQYIHRLTLGAPIDTVEYDLGMPAFSEAFARDGMEYRIHFYRTHHVKSDSKTTREETTPLVFEDGRLVGWGEFYYQQLLGQRARP